MGAGRGPTGVAVVAIQQDTKRGHAVTILRSAAYWLCALAGAFELSLCGVVGECARWPFGAG